MWKYSQCISYLQCLQTGRHVIIKDEIGFPFPEDLLYQSLIYSLSNPPFVHPSWKSLMANITFIYSNEDTETTILGKLR